MPQSKTKKARILTASRSVEPSLSQSQSTQTPFTVACACCHGCGPVISASVHLPRLLPLGFLVRGARLPWAAMLRCRYPSFRESSKQLPQSTLSPLALSTVAIPLIFVRGRLLPLSSTQQRSLPLRTQAHTGLVTLRRLSSISLSRSLSVPLLLLIPLILLHTSSTGHVHKPRQKKTRQPKLRASMPQITRFSACRAWHTHSGLTVGRLSLQNFLTHRNACRPRHWRAVFLLQQSDNID